MRLGGGLVLACLAVSAQTAINLRTQASNIDFSAAPATKPFKTGDSLPASCGSGEAFLLTATASLPALYVCGAPPAWTLIAGAAELSAITAAPGIVIQEGDPVSGGQSIGIDDAVVAQYSAGSADPAGDCQPGRLHYRTDTRGLWFCAATSVWQEVATLTSGRLTYSQFPALTGDVASAGGTFDTSVVRIQGRNVAATAPDNGQVMLWSGANQQWEPGTVNAGGGVTSVTVAGTDRQVAASGACSITSSGACTLSLPPDLLLPAGTAFTPSTAAAPSFNLPAGSAPANPAAGDFWNLGGVLQYRYGGATRSLATTDAASITMGLLTAARGGLGTDASAFNGIVKMSGGAASMVTGAATDCVYVNGMSGACGAGSGVDPLDSTRIYAVDDFAGGGNGSGTTGTIGASLGNFSAGCTSPVATYEGGTANNPFTLKFGCAGTSDQHGRSYFWPSIGSDLINNGGWVTEFIFQLDSALNNRLRVGIGSQNTNPNPTNFIGVRVDSNASWENAATPNFILCACNGTAKANCADLDLGVAADTNFHRLRLTSDVAGTIRVLWDNAVEKTICPSASCALNATGKMPALTTQFRLASLAQEGTTAKTMHLDRVAFGWTGRTARW